MESGTADILVTRATHHSLSSDFGEKPTTPSSFNRSSTVTTYGDNIWILFQLRGSVVPHALLGTIPCLIIALALSIFQEVWSDYRTALGLETVSDSVLWSAVSFVLVILLAFRTRQAYARFWEGSGLLHQMRGEWFDAASCLVTFSRDAKIQGRAADVREFRQTLIRLMSLMHGMALDEISGNEVHYEVIDIHGLDTATLVWLRECHESYSFRQVEALQHMIQVLITHNHHSGVLTIPAPILSRVFQTLSRGLVHLLNARKIKDTMFPFPYAQVLKLLLVVHCIFTPILITSKIDNIFWAAVLSTIPVFGMFCLNFTAIQLEMPFGLDTNDLPLPAFQEEMNDVLMMLLHEKSDHLARSSKVAKKQFEELALPNRKSHSSIVQGSGFMDKRNRIDMRKTFSSTKSLSVMNSDLERSMDTDSTESPTKEKERMAGYNLWRSPEGMYGSQETLPLKRPSESSYSAKASSGFANFVGSHDHLPQSSLALGSSSECLVSAMRRSCDEQQQPVPPNSVASAFAFSDTLQDFSQLLGKLVDIEAKRMDLLRHAENQLLKIRENVVSAEHIGVPGHAALSQFLRNGDKTSLELQREADSTWPLARTPRTPKYVPQLLTTPRSPSTSACRIQAKALDLSRIGNDDPVLPPPSLAMVPEEK